MPYPASTLPPTLPLKLPESPDRISNLPKALGIRALKAPNPETS